MVGVGMSLCLMSMCVLIVFLQVHSIFCSTFRRIFFLLILWWVLQVNIGIYSAMPESECLVSGAALVFLINVFSCGERTLQP